MDQEILRKFEALCIQEEAPACQSSCPLHVDARTFLQFMAENKKEKARQILDKSLPLSMLTAFLCEGECRKACRRGEVDQSIQMPGLERACVLNTKSSKVMAFPSTGKKFALVGAGLSSFVLAHELAKKGHNITIFHKNELGFDLKTKKIETFPLTALEECLSVLKTLKVKFLEIQTIDEHFLASITENFLFAYFAKDDSFIMEALNTDHLEDFKQIFSDISPITLQSKNSQIFMGGSENLESCIQSIADGKRVTLSMERVMQGVDPATAREKEAPYATRLYTNLENIENRSAVVFSDSLAPSMEEATEEAKRCIHCSCLECVKQCSYLANFKNYPKRYLREIYNNLALVNGYRQANTMINTCTQCGLCAKICPKNLNMGEYVDIARRELVKRKHMPPSAHEFALDDMVFSNSDAIQFIRKQKGMENTKNTYVFFPGCQLPAVLPSKVEKAYSYLTKHLQGGVTFHLACCSIPAEWAAKEQYTKAYVEQFYKNWLDMEKPVYIFACASCSDFFRRNCPKIEQISLWEIMEKSPLPQASLALDHPLTVHDPCSSRDTPNTQNAVRALLQNIRQDVQELHFSKELTRCCGYGGLASNARQEIADTFLSTRQQEAEAPLLVYCAICRERYQKINQNSLHILELLFAEHQEKTIEERQAILKENMTKKLLSPMERQLKRQAFRDNFLTSFFGEETKTMQTSNLTLNISDEVSQKLSQRHILKEDIITVIQKTKDDNSALYNQATGNYLAAYRPRLVTFWVEYKEEADASFTIHNAYCHRMVVPGIITENQTSLFEQTCCNQKESN